MLHKTYISSLGQSQDPGPKQAVGHALSVPDSEGSQLLPEDLGPGEPVSGLRP